MDAGSLPGQAARARRGWGRAQRAFRPASALACGMRSGACSSVYGSHSACRSFQNLFWNSSCTRGQHRGGGRAPRRASRDAACWAAGRAAASRPCMSCRRLRRPQAAGASSRTGIAAAGAAPTMGTQSRSSTASYPDRASSTAKLRPSWRRGKPTGPGWKGTSCGSASTRLLRGPLASVAATGCSGGRPAAAADALSGCNGWTAGAAAAAAVHSSALRSTADRLGSACRRRCC